MQKKQKILFINWGTHDKEYTLKTAYKKGLQIYLATGKNYPSWVKKYVSPANMIFTNPFDSEILLTDVVVFMNTNNLKFDGITAFFEMNIIATSYLAKMLNLPFIDSNAARTSSANKFLMRLTCRQGGLPTPQFAFFNNLETGLKAIKEFKSPVVIKPNRAGSSYGVYKVEGKTRQDFIKDFKHKYLIACRQMDRIYKGFEPMNETYGFSSSMFIIEEYVPGTVFSVDGIIQDGKLIFSAVTEFETTPGPSLKQNATIIPSSFPPGIQKKCRVAAKKVIKVLKFDNCGFHIEMALTKTGPILIEAASRLPGGKILEAYQKVYKVNLVSLLLDMALGKKLREVKEKVYNYVIIEANFTSESGLITKVGKLVCKISSKLMLMFYVDKGIIINEKDSFSSMYLYFMLSNKNKEQLLEDRKSINKDLAITVEKNMLYWLINIRNSIFTNFSKRFILFSIIILEIVVGLFFLKYIYSSAVKQKQIKEVATIDQRLLKQSSDLELKYFYEPEANQVIKDHQEWLEKDVEYTINNDSLNERFDYSVVKPPSTFRIMTIGDSHTFGHFVNTQDNYPEKMEDLLLGMNTQGNFCPSYSNIEVINLGMMGYDVEYTTHRYQARGQKYSPDAILWYIKDDDFTQILEQVAPKIKYLEKEYIKRDPRYLDDPSKRYSAWIDANAELEKTWGIDKIINYNGSIVKDFLSNLNIPLVFIAYYDDSRTPSILESYAKLFSNVHLFIETSYADIDRLADGHPSSLGYTKLSKSLTNYLVNNQSWLCGNY